MSPPHQEPYSLPWFALLRYSPSSAFEKIKARLRSVFEWPEGRTVRRRFDEVPPARDVTKREGLGSLVGSGHRFSCRSQGHRTFCLPRVDLDQVTEPNSFVYRESRILVTVLYVTRVCVRFTQAGYVRGRAIVPVDERLISSRIFFLLLFPRLFLFSCVRIRFLWFLHVLF